MRSQGSHSDRLMGCLRFRRVGSKEGFHPPGPIRLPMPMTERGNPARSPIAGVAAGQRALQRLA
jgi:hypothetical protein